MIEPSIRGLRSCLSQPARQDDRCSPLPEGCIPVRSWQCSKRAGAEVARCYILSCKRRTSRTQRCLLLAQPDRNSQGSWWSYCAAAVQQDSRTRLQTALATIRISTLMLHHVIKPYLPLLWQQGPASTAASRSMPAGRLCLLLQEFATAAPWHCFVSAAAFKSLGCMRHSLCPSMLEPLFRWLCGGCVLTVLCPVAGPVLPVRSCRQGKRLTTGRQLTCSSQQQVR